MDYKYVIGSIVILIVAVVYFLNPPKQINAFYGYRTPLSRKNPENWIKANRLASVILLLLSFVLVLLSVLFFVLKWEGTETIWFNTLLLGIISLVLIVEIKLRKTHSN